MGNGKWEKRCLKTKGSNLKEIFPKREEVGGNEKITLGQNKGRKEKKYGKEIKCKQGVSGTTYLFSRLPFPTL